MKKPRTLVLAEGWVPDPDDPHGEDKRRLINYLIANKVSSANPVTLKALLKNGKFAQSYTREALQHKLLGPLRRDPRLFVGTSSRGIFLVLTPEDADATLGFYTWRVRAELRHARNLRTLAKRTKLFAGYQSKPPDSKQRAIVYIDESGSADVSSLDPPVFVVAAVVIDSRQELAGLDQRFKNAFAVINRPEDHEFKTAGLSVAKHKLVLRELSLAEFQWAAACFDKAKLTSAGFADPKTFYRYAFQFLIGDLLSVAWQSELVIDEHSTPAFQHDLENYLRRQNSGLPIQRLQAVRFAQSSRNRLIQLADLVAGAVRRSVRGEHVPLREIEHKKINLQFWPPK